MIIKLILTWILLIISTAIIGIANSESDYAETILKICYCELGITLVGILIGVWSL